MASNKQRAARLAPIRSDSIFRLRFVSCASSQEHEIVMGLEWTIRDPSVGILINDNLKLDVWKFSLYQTSPGALLPPILHMVYPIPKGLFIDPVYLVFSSI